MYMTTGRLQGCDSWLTCGDLTRMTVTVTMGRLLLLLHSPTCAFQGLCEMVCNTRVFHPA